MAAHAASRHPRDLTDQQWDRRFQRWVRAGVLRTVRDILAQTLHDEGYLDVQETFIDGSFAPAKHLACCVILLRGL